MIDIDFDRALRTWQRKSRLSLDEIRQAFTFDSHYERHECGEIETSDYYDHLASVLQIEADHSYIDEGWNSIYVGEIAETIAMVRAVKVTVPCYALTNTNAAHAAVWSQKFPAVVASFDRIFTSHEMGWRKPDRKVFEHICQTISVAAESIVFFDDRLENVQGARAANLQAVHVRSPSDVRRALESLGEL